MTRLPITIAPELRMPLDAITHTFGIFGQKGSGKSSTSALFVEQGVAAGGRFVIADPTGAWWGLMHDGLGPGLPGIVFGGEHGDVPLERTGGHVVAEFVVQQDAYPVVVLDMKLLRKADRTTFMLAFLETLYHDNREALHVVLDESWQFAPTRASEGGETIKLLGAVEDVVALGRTRGLGITMISQRFATLNANVREQIGTLVAHRLVGALDRKALKGWIEANADPAREKEVLDVMAKLKDATALVWSPAFLEYFGVVHVNAPQTFDSRATPKVGQRVAKPGKRAPVDLNTLREKMAATIEEHRANDPKELKRANSELQRRLADANRRAEELELAAAEASNVQEVEVKVKVPVFEAEEIARAGKITDSLASVSAELLEAAQTIDKAVERAAATVASRVPDRAHPRRPAPAPAPKRTHVAPPRRDTADLDQDGLTGPEQRVLDAVAWYGVLGNSTPSKQQVGLIAGYRVGKNVGGTYGNILGKLRSRGLLDYPTKGTVALTADGERVARDPGIDYTNEAIQEAVMARLNGPEQRVLRVLIGYYPNSMRKQDVGAASGYTVGANVGGTFGNILGRLRSLGVIDYVNGEAVATDVLFPLAANRS